MKSNDIRCVFLIVAMFMICSVQADDADKIDTRLVGNHFAFFNPVAGGGTQMWGVDIDNTGSYVAFCTNADVDAVRGRLEFTDDKWALTSEGRQIDKGTIEFMGPSITLRSGKGAMMLNRLNPESKQALLEELGIDPTKASIPPFLTRGLKIAREWRNDAILVDIRCTPGIDGSIDLTTQGGNLMFMYYSSSRDAGALAMVSAWGEISLTPQKEPVSPWKLAIPTNIIDVSAAVKIANQNGVKRVKDAELHGMGDDPDLRMYCWVMGTENGRICVDAIIPQVHGYNYFMNGAGRASGNLPFMPNSGMVYRVSVSSNREYYMYFYRAHAVFLDGVDEAIMIRVPWRYIKEEEWRPYVTEKDGSMMVPDLEGKLEIGPYTKLTPEEFKRLSAGSSALLLDCPPKLVLMENCPIELVPRVKAQLESYWRAQGETKRSNNP